MVHMHVALKGLTYTENQVGVHVFLAMGTKDFSICPCIAST